MAASPLADMVLGGTVSVDSEGVISLHTGAMYGPVDVGIELLDRAPGPPAVGWEDVVELSADATESEPITLVGIFSDSADTPHCDSGIPVVTSGQSYRVRVHVRGRDNTATDELIESGQEAKDHFLLQVWPAIGSDPEVVRISSSKARDDGAESEYVTTSGAVILGMGDTDPEGLKARNLKGGDD